MEAVCYKKNEYLYQAELPNGRTITLKKDQSSNFKGTDSNWKGTVIGDSFQLSLGPLDTVIYRQGELKSFTSGKTTFEVFRTSVGAFILKDGKVLYSLIKSSDPLLDKIQIKDAEGQIVSRFDVERTANLSGFNPLSSFSVGNFAMETSPLLNENKIPTGIKIGDERVEWDPTSGKVKRIGDFSYQIECDKSGLINQISKKSLQPGAKSSAYIDAQKGIDIKEDGDKFEEKHYFIAGNQAGRIRRLIQKTNNEITLDVSYYYDQAGSFIAKKSSAESLISDSGNLLFHGGSMDGLNISIK